MPIKFIVDEKSKENQLTFEMVGEDQFFVNGYGYLCQKVTSSCYITLANADGIPIATVQENIESDEKILRILSRIKKIEF